MPSSKLKSPTILRVKPIKMKIKNHHTSSPVVVNDEPAAKVARNRKSDVSDFGSDEPSGRHTRRAASKVALAQMAEITKSQDEDDFIIDKKTVVDDPVWEDEDELPLAKRIQKKHKKKKNKEESISDDRDAEPLAPPSLVTHTEAFNIDCWVEELSEEQQALYDKRKKEEEDMERKMAFWMKDLGAEVIFEGEDCKILGVEHPPATSILPAPAPLILAQPTTNGTAPTPTYSLVLDPRSGQVLGTITPTTQAIPAVSAPGPKLPIARRKTKGVVPNTAAVGPNKVQKLVIATASVHQPILTPQILSVQSLSGSKPAETTAIGGIQPTSAGEKRADAVVDLTADEAGSAEKCSSDTKEVSFNKLQGKTYPSLVVVARPSLRAPAAPNTQERARLDQKVKAVLMFPATKFTEWLIQQGLVRADQKCLLHPTNKLKLGMYSDVSKFPFSGGYVWISDCCPQRFVSVFSGSLFEGSPHPPSVILKCIYHWACQTNVQNVIQWVKVENVYVKGIYTWLRAICSVSLYTKIKQLGGPGVKVEIGVISLGTTSPDGQQRQVKVEVLGILETESKKIRLRAVEPLVDGDRNYKRRFTKILEPLGPWVHPESLICTDLTVDKSTLQAMGFRNVQQSNTSTGNSQIMDYLRRIVPRMFQNTLSLLSRQIIQQFLDELVWREWFGSTAAQAFDNLVADIATQTKADTGQNLVIRLNRVAMNPFKNWSVQHYITAKDDSLTQHKSRNKRKASVTPRSTSPSAIESQKSETHSEPKQKKSASSDPELPETLVPIEHYYYGTIQGNDDQCQIEEFNMKCLICKEGFTNSIELMTHYYRHAHNMKSPFQCIYCLTGCTSQESLENHIAALHPSDTKTTRGMVCVLCEKKFDNAFFLGKHLSLNHVPSELPYQCEVCSFRCSNHKQIIDHFHSKHNSHGVLQCPFCLKTMVIAANGRTRPKVLTEFVVHLQKHQRKSLVKKCSRCALWFHNKEKLMVHQKAHETQRKKAGLEPWPIRNVLVPKSIADTEDENDVDVDISNLQMVDVPATAICKECNTKMVSSQHYPSRMTCDKENCNYSTFCRLAMGNHTLGCPKTEPVASIKLPYKMYCICGHEDTDGNSMAKHLAICERQSAYPSREEAKQATVTHSMLDVLGLVRRPGETTDKEDKSDKDASEIETVELDDDAADLGDDNQGIENDTADMETEKNAIESESDDVDNGDKNTEENVESEKDAEVNDSDKADNNDAEESNDLEDDLEEKSKTSGAEQVQDDENQGAFLEDKAEIKDEGVVESNSAEYSAESLDEQQAKVNEKKTVRDDADISEEHESEPPAKKLKLAEENETTETDPDKVFDSLLDGVNTNMEGVANEVDNLLDDIMESQDDKSNDPTAQTASSTEA